jgi:hypothetical protein
MSFPYATTGAGLVIDGDMFFFCVAVLLPTVGRSPHGLLASLAEDGSARIQSIHRFQLP